MCYEVSTPTYSRYVSSINTICYEITFERCVTSFVTFITGHPDSIVIILSEGLLSEKTPRDEIVHDFKGQ